MTKAELVNKIQHRKKELNITMENLAKLSDVGMRTLNRFFACDDVRLSTVEKITNILGLDFAGNEVISLDKLKAKRAREKAIMMTSFVQSTSALEMQGLEKNSIDKMIYTLEQEFLSGQYKDRLWVA
ncbi:MAG: hypothetical protein PHO62_01950 [Sulfurimonas sp.]|uniref:helix-turn-helix domain-containing protein n=1 Tax=Sulfurimonas sp. TaxID=2022749 RepID=UPI00260E55E4|nr:hypothetical protein [Sulfurimonas sp.]MDD5372170.1 hypothetical protein [Sulfurimonas sp.]